MKFHMLFNILFVCLLGLSFQLRANDISTTEGYFTIDDSVLHVQHQGFHEPMQLVWEVASISAEGVLSLTKWIPHSAELPLPTDKYNRKNHFGTWARTEADCQNTRAKILIQNSKKQVTFTTAESCTVLDGQWEEPYTGNTYTSAKDLQIDHLVPLKNAYDMGAWKWTNQRRCLYANFVANEFHLLTVNGTENTKKGAKTPNEYMPPNEKYACDYLQQWLMTKTIWNLALTVPEAAGIEKLIQEHNCSASQLQIPVDFLKKLRNNSDGQLDLCWNNYYP